MSIDSQPYQANDATNVVGEIFSGDISISQALERLRTRLLDLSARNGLLNYRHPKGRCLQFVGNPNLNLVFERLYGETKGVSLKYVPEPSTLEYEGKRPEAKVYAAQVGIDTSVEFKPNDEGAKGHRLHGIQTLLYPQELEKQVRKLSGEANTAIEETGSNMLFMIWGFLEFYDSEDSDRPLHAPLLSLPVTLVKGAVDPDTRTYQYTVQHNGEDLAENHTLREKLRRDFLLSIPEFDEEADTPEIYFQKIEQAVSKKKRWQVKRQLTLGMLSFGKLAIWADLDSKKNSALLENELIKSVFSGKVTGGGDGLHAEDYDIDQHPEGNLQFIFDADSSQHSAIIDVLAGKNLVINGPPGTGKSQTITNIIASALSQGKKILFVSEKLAALEVVRRRLNMAGLGHFCLELHSHKTQKKKFLEDIETRIEAKFTSATQLQNKISILQRQKDQLGRYAELMGSSVGNRLGMTVHEIFWAAERRRQDLDDLSKEVSSIGFNDANEWTHDDLVERKSLIEDLASLYEEIGSYDKDHPWWGFKANSLTPADDDNISQIISTALTDAIAADSIAEEINSVFKFAQQPEVDSIQRISNDLNLISLPDERISCELLPRLFNRGTNDSSAHQSSTIVEEVKRSIEKARSLQTKADAIFDDMPRQSDSELNNVTRYGPDFLPEAVMARPLGSIQVEIAEFRKSLSSFEHTIKTTNPRFVALPDTQHQQIFEACKKVQQLNLEDQPIGTISAQIPKIEQAINQLNASLKMIQSFCAQRSQPFDATPSAVKALLDGSAFRSLIPEATPTEHEAEQALELIKHSLAARSIQELKQLTSLIEIEATEINLSLQNCREITSRIDSNLICSEDLLGEIKTLIQISNSAPHELLDYRKPGLASSRAQEVLSKIEEFLERDKTQFDELQKIFYLDAIPTNDQLSEAISVLRSKDGFFALFDSTWRAAKSFHSRLSKKSAAMPAKMRSEELSRLLSWIKERNEFLTNVEAKEIFGDLFRGLDTNPSQLKQLLEWLLSSRNKLSQCPNLVGRIDLIALPSHQITSLVAGARRFESAADRIVSGFDRLSQQFGPGISSLKESRRKSIDSTLHLIRDEKVKIAQLHQHFEKFCNAGSSPKACQQELVLKSEIFQIRADLERLDHGGLLLNAASGTIFVRAIEKPISNWKAYLDDVNDVASVIKSAIQLSTEISTASLTITQLAEICSHYIDFKSSWIRLKTPPSPLLFSSWDSLLSAAKLDLSDLEIISKTASKCIPDHNSIADFLMAIKCQEESKQILSDLCSSDRVMRLVQPVYQGLETNLDTLDQTLAWGKNVNTANLPPEVHDYVLSIDAKKHLQFAQKVFFDITRYIGSIKSSLEGLERYGNFYWDQWQLQCRSKPGVDFPSEIRSRLERAASSSNAVLTWSKYLSTREAIKNSGLHHFLKKLETGSIPAPCLVQAFELSAFQSIGRLIYQKYPELQQFNSLSHDRVRTEFQRLDSEIIQLTGKDFAHRISRHAKVPEGTTGSKVGDFTEMHLLRREFRKQRRHIPIRQLLKRAGHALQELKPVFMMGPMSVAQYLEQDALSFDLVVMDEASQLRPEDAMGAVARGKQLVVVGDPKQLPPTNFFDRLSDSTDEESDDDAPAAITGMESILDICQQLFTPTRSLRWHYRSQHESLIAFSNHHFYRNLVVFPSPYAKASKLGVKYRYVANGIYKDRQNFPEAERVVDAVLDHMVKHSDASLGVVTLNQTQRELIEELLENKLKTFPEGNEFKDKWESEGWPFFIKNLENVQGDERDVIFISTTFGKAPGTTRPRQNFGPISRPDGWRRLNVLFTRSRQRIELFTSMRPDDIISDEKTPLGTKALKDYLDFAKRGVLVTTDESDREPDSDFEVSVAEVIRSMGFEVKPQLGVAGFFIDMVVKNPDRPGEYLAAIECDGATYHSGFSVRDRDRIRQEILESLGWKDKIYRIWSTDWFYNPRESVFKLQRFLQDRQKQSVLEGPTDFEMDESEALDFNSDASLEDVISIAEEKMHTDISVITSSDSFVEVGDKVTYCLVETPAERHTVWISDSESNAKLGIVNENAPLAQALLGLSEGEIGDLEVVTSNGRKTHAVKVLKISSRELEG